MTKPKRVTARSLGKHIPEIDMSDLLTHHTAASLPDEVPVLTADDMHVGGYVSEDGTRFCLLGHAREVGRKMALNDGVAPGPADYQADFHACSVRYAVLRHTMAISDRTIAAFNDHYASKAAAARVWNAAMRDLGYTEGNPEA